MIDVIKEIESDDFSKLRSDDDDEISFNCFDFNSSISIAEWR